MSRPVGVVIGTYGDRPEWTKIAMRAIQSIKDQTSLPDHWIHVHDKTLAKARNLGAEVMANHGVERLIFLDADDELDPKYIEEMRSYAGFDSNPHVIYRPSTFGVYEDGTQDTEPVMLPKTDLKRRNCVVIGAMCPTHLFREVGGFGEDPVLEDWDLWIRMVRAGASIKDVNHAIYRVHVNPKSRNQDTALHAKVYREIQKRYKW